MREPSAYDFAVVRVVPRVERQEFRNVGVILFARTREFLDCALDDPAAIERGLRALACTTTAAVLRHLEGIRAVCAGEPGGGPIAQLPRPERFHWLIAPRSTQIQCSPQHSGVGVDPARALHELFARLVAR